MTEHDSSTTAAWERWLERFEEHRRAYREWVARQPVRHLATTGLLGVVAFWAAYLAIRFLSWLITSLVGLVSWFSSDAPAPAPPPPEAAPPNPLRIAAGQTVDYLANLAQRWLADHAFGGVDPLMVLAMWGLVGLVLLVCSRSLIGLPLALGWSVATVAVVYIAAANPVPAALAAGGLALIWCAWWLASGFVKALFS